MRLSPDLLRRCWFLAGSTASGKTDVAIELARKVEGGAEIIAMDSMTLYREMDIGTAKPTAGERAAVPHHMLDLADPADDFSVADYLTAVQPVVAGILDRGRVPLFVGGTGLYLRSLLRGVFEGPEADWAFRRQLESELASSVSDSLHRRLAKIDPPSAARLHPADTRRIIRAIEIHHLTGRPASEQQNEMPLPLELRPPNVLWLDRSRAELHERIDRRVDAMVSTGLAEEVRRLRERPAGIGRTARQALGYKELLDWLDGVCTEAEAIANVKARTRQFAKRQVTWFRNLEECRPVSVRPGSGAAEIADEILSRPAN